MYRKSTWGIQNELDLHSQLRQKRRLEMLEKKRAAASSRKLYVSNTFNPPSLDKLQDLVEQMHSEVHKEVMDALLGLKKIFCYQPSPVDLVLKQNILPKLSELLDNNNISMKNLVTTIIACLSMTDDLNAIQQMFELGIVKRLADFVKNNYSIKYSNIFEQAYTALANIMKTNDQCRDMCIAYGFLPQFFNLCSKILDNMNKNMIQDQTLPEALCHMLSALTSGKTCCSTEIAVQIVPYVFKMGKGFEGDSSIHILTTLINLSKFGQECIQCLVSDKGLIDFLQGILNMKYCDYQVYVMHFIWNCAKVFPPMLNEIFPLFETVYDVFSQASNAIYHDFCCFLKLYITNKQYSAQCLEIIKTYHRSLGSVISNLENNCSETVFESIDFVMLLIKFYQDKDLFVTMCVKGLMDYSVSALKKTCIVEKPAYARQLLEIIFMAFKLEESGEVKAVELMVEENEDDNATKDTQEKINKAFIECPPSHRFAGNKGFEELDILLIQCPELSGEVNSIKQFANHLLKLNNDPMAL